MNPANKETVTPAPITSENTPRKWFSLSPEWQARILEWRTTYSPRAFLGDYTSDLGLLVKGLGKTALGVGIGLAGGALMVNTTVEISKLPSILWQVQHQTVYFDPVAVRHYVSFAGSAPHVLGPILAFIGERWINSGFEMITRKP